MSTNKPVTFFPLLAEAPSFKRFAGNYFLTRVIVKTDALEQPYRVLTFSDGSGDINVFCTNPALLQIELRPNSIVHVEAALKQNGGQARFYCKNLMQISNNQRLGSDLSCLPRSLCPLPEAFDAFFIMISRIHHPLLQTFLRHVLLQPNVAVRYLQCPASLNHHHNYPGGLLQHSVHVAWEIFGVHELNRLDKDISLVCALLHDIGKTQTMTPDMTRTAIGRLVDHSQLTLELCAEALKELESQAPGIAYQLRHAWTCYSPNARFGFKPKTLVAKTLRRVDGISAKWPEWTLPNFAQESLASMQQTRAAM